MIEFDDQTREALLITQEECAEVTQAISKVFRFGFDSVWPIDHSSPNNKERLEEEVGDLLAMVDILIEKCIISDSNVNEARHKKRQKLTMWSGIK